MAQYVSEENLKLYDKLLKEYILTKSESLLNLLSYGVRWEKELKDPHLTRIGNLEWHRTLPLQSQMRGCIVLSPSKGIHIVKYWLHPDDWRFRKDNTEYVFNSEVSTVVENDTTYYTITDSTRFSDLGYKRLYVKINGIIGLIIDITDNTAKIKLENTLDAGTYEIELGSRTNGYDGEVMVYMPGGYLHSVDDPSYSEVRISPFNVGEDWEYHKPGYISAYRITVLNEVPTDMGYLSTIPVNSAISVANVETYCRGGGNRPEYDLYLETDPFRSDLGKPRNSITNTAIRLNARKVNSELISYFLYKFLYWLYVIEYANFNSQEIFNLELTTEGFKLGGLSLGLTNANGNYVSIYNGRYALSINGLMQKFGNISSIDNIHIKLPIDDTWSSFWNLYSNINSYRGVENLFGDIYTYIDGIIISEDDLVFITSNPDYYIFSGNYKETMIHISEYSSIGGLIKEFNLKNNAEIIPKSTTNGGLNLYKCDGNSTNKSLGKRTVFIGGHSSDTSTAGIIFFRSTGSITVLSTLLGFRSFKELSMESIVITSDSNAPLMSAMYNAGLASNPDYMTKSEVEKVTTLEGIDFTNVVSFDEFKYFTGVTEIPNKCFLKNTSLTSIICPNSLITIGDQAFSTCSNLSYIKIGKYVTSIGDLAFAACSKLTNVIIPNFVTSIGEGAFLCCYGLKSIKLSNSLTSISPYMFRECTALTSVIIPDSVTFIGNSVFSYCNRLESIVVESGNSVFDSRNNCNAIIETATNKLLYGCKNTTIPDSITSIGAQAFSECPKLTDITIPNSVTIIGNWAFLYCHGLISIEIGNSITSLGNGAFRNCDSLSSIKCLATTAPTVKSITFGNSDTSYTGRNTYNQGVNKLYIPAGATGYDTGAWLDPLQNAEKCGFTIELLYAVKRETNPELMDICVANGWSTNKDYMTFKEAAAITADMIAPISDPDTGNESKFKTLTHFKEFLYFTGVKEIKDSTFYGCESLTLIEIPDSVTSIGNDAFGECYELINITNIPDSVNYIGDGAFEFCDSLTSINIPNSITSINSYTFSDCSSLTSIIIPNSVTSINDGAFSNCSSLTSINIPNSVNYIGEEVFNYCSNLNTIVVLEGNTVYDSRNNCNAIIKTNTNTLIIGCKNTIIPNSVTSIGSSAFYGHSSLISIIIPNSVTSIGNNAFYSCSGLTNITIPNSVTSILDYTFYSCSGLITITIPNSVTSIGSKAFLDCSGLTSITIPNSVTSIGSSAFIGCSGLTSITIPNSVTSIGSKAFIGCSSLTSITIPNSVTSIGSSAFSNCSSLKNITISNSVTLISYGAFENCSSLTTVTIPNSVTSIGVYAFRDCSSLTSIVIPDSVTSIGSYTFSSCSSLSSITCLAATAPTVKSSTFGSSSGYAGRNTYNQGINKLKVPQGATGYDTGYWLDPLLNSSKCGFTIEYI